MEKENSIKKMSETPVDKLMLSMGIPMIVSMVLQAFITLLTVLLYRI